MNHPLSDILRSLILRGGSDYTVAGLWSGGVIAVINSVDRPPAVFFQAADLTAFDKAEAPRIRGLSIHSHQISIAGRNQSGILLQLASGEPIDPFLSLVDYLFEKLSFEAEEEASWKSIFRVVEDWMEFWRARGQAPIREVLLGLVGELLTITQLLEHNGLSYEVWQGPLGGTHDFKKGQNALEVKASGSRSGPLVHKVASQHQLKLLEEGTLYVHSLRIQLGSNVPNKIVDLIGEAESTPLFNSPDGLIYFRDSLALLIDPNGHSSIPEKFSTYDVLESNLIMVDEDFPRIEPGDLRNGVVDVKYSVDLTSFITEETATRGRKFDLTVGSWAIHV